jgi:hypothetical protein
LKAVPVLERVAVARRAMLAVASHEGDALRRSATERFTRGFLAREGLRAHLEDWAADPSTTTDDRRDARELLDQIEREREPPGKALGPAAHPISAGPEITKADVDGPGHRLRREVEIIPASRYWLTATKIEEVFFDLEARLRGHPDYTGTACSDIKLLIVFLITFLSHCLDVGRYMAEDVFRFLLDRTSTKPLEVELQRALFSFLRLQLWGFPQHTVVREAHDVAAGRADIAIIRPDWRIVLEVKRELDDASRDSIRKYLGQAASYELTGPRVGFLIVLDLCSQKDWALTLEDNCWIEKVMSERDTSPRVIVVVRVPGVRTVPSATATPSAHIPGSVAGSERK